MRRPAFNIAWCAFMDVKVPVAEVGKKIGGYVQKNIELPDDSRRFKNACPIRISYVLNKAGLTIQKNSLYESVSGADGKQYIYKVVDMIRYLENTFGKPDKFAKSPKTSDFSGAKGIIAIRGHGWGNASGHVTLWNGTACSDSCHLMYDPDNGTFTPESGSLWVLL